MLNIKQVAKYSFDISDNLIRHKTFSTNEIILRNIRLFAKNNFDQSDCHTKQKIGFEHDYAQLTKSW